MEAEDEFQLDGAATVPAVCVANSTALSLTSRTFFEYQNPMMVRGLRASGLIPTDVEEVPDKTPRQSTFHKEAPLMVYEKYVRGMDGDGFIPIRLFRPKKRAATSASLAACMVTVWPVSRAKSSTRCRSLARRLVGKATTILTSRIATRPYCARCCVWTRSCRRHLTSI